MDARGKGTWLDPLWLQGGLDALRAMFDVDPSTKTQMIQFLLDEGFWSAESITWDAAVARYNACLNPRKGEFFKFVELWALAKRFGQHRLFEAAMRDLGYEIRLRSTEERRLALLERIAVALEAQGREVGAATAELERLDALTTPSQRLDPTVRGGTARFSKPADVEGWGF